MSFQHHEKIQVVMDGLQRHLSEKYPALRKDVSFATGNGVISVETPWICVADVFDVERFKKLCEMSDKQIDEIIASPNFDGYHVFRVDVRNILHSTENPDGQLVFFRIVGAKDKPVEKAA